MLANDREQIVAVFDALHAAVSRLTELSFETLTTPERLDLLERLEQATRSLPVARHELINGVRRQATPAEIGGKLAHVLADRLRITRAESARRIDEAADLGQRSALTGEPLAAQLSATAVAQHDGKIGSGHVRVIRGFLRDLPCWIDADTRAHAETQLAEFATQYRPEQLGKLADKLADCLNPDGDFDDEDRARRRGLTVGKQDRDGMSPLRGWLTRRREPPWNRYWPSWPPPAWPTPMPKTQSRTALPAKTPSTAIPGQRRSATTMVCMRRCVRC